MLVWPDDLPAPAGRIVGADAMHRHLVSWLEHLEHRRDLRPGVPAESPLVGDGPRAPELDGDATPDVAGEAPARRIPSPPGGEQRP
jgi:hypothetical protein